MEKYFFRNDLQNTTNKINLTARKGSLIDPDTGEEHLVGGCRRSDEPLNLPKFGASRHLSSKSLPQTVDLRPLMTPVENQDNTRSCVANALAGAYEFLIKKRSGKHIDVSRLFIYYNARCKDGVKEYLMDDNGTGIRSGIDALAEFGCCKEKTYPYVLANIDKKPPHYCYVEAANYRIRKAMNVNLNLDEMKACLAEGFPFVFGIKLFQSFLTAKKNGGYVPIPRPRSEPTAKGHDGHAMLAVGYDDDMRRFIVRNSWGERWGHKGYCYIPYDYMTNPDLCFDLTAIKIVADDSRQPGNKLISSSHQSKILKSKAYFGSSEMPEDEYHYTFFWKIYNIFDQFSTIWKDRILSSSSSSPKQSSPEHNDNKQLQIVSKYSVLWIDQQNEDNLRIVKQLTNNNKTEMLFCETLSKAENYLWDHMNEMKLSSKFQIICRGYYKSENKNPLNLLQFLNNYGLHHIPILVFTQDKAGLKHHLQNQAPLFNLNDWQYRLVITDTPEELIQKIQKNMSNKH
ncbi:hypothetical protein I4U23_004062 [Adineta vaga]|nr:hypothetical protein I4U23_004062 [Adineta vaga]